jgi:hypothetical protein
MNLMPNVDQLSRVISEATAPAFVLTAVAGFVSVLRAYSQPERSLRLRRFPCPPQNRTFLDCGSEPPS